MTLLASVTVAFLLAGAAFAQPAVEAGAAQPPNLGEPGLAIS